MINIFKTFFLACLYNLIETHVEINYSDRFILEQNLVITF